MSQRKGKQSNVWWSASSLESLSQPPTPVARHTMFATTNSWKSRSAQPHVRGEENGAGSIMVFASITIFQSGVLGSKLALMTAFEPTQPPKFCSVSETKLTSLMPYCIAFSYVVSVRWRSREPETECLPISFTAYHEVTKQRPSWNNRCAVQ